MSLHYGILSTVEGTATKNKKKEASDAFCKAMNENRADDTLHDLNELKAITELLKYIQ